MYSNCVLSMLKLLNITSLDSKQKDIGVIYRDYPRNNTFLVCVGDYVESVDPDIFENTDIYMQVNRINYTYDDEYKIFEFTYDTNSPEYEDNDKFIGTISKEDLINNGIEVL